MTNIVSDFPGVFSSLTFNSHSFLISEINLFLLFFVPGYLLWIWLTWRPGERRTGRTERRKRWRKPGWWRRRMTQSEAADRCVELTSALHWWDEMRKWRRDHWRVCNCQIGMGKKCAEKEGKRKRHWGWHSVKNEC